MSADFPVDPLIDEFLKVREDPAYFFETYGGEARASYKRKHKSLKHVLGGGGVNTEPAVNVCHACGHSVSVASRTLTHQQRGKQQRNNAY